MVGKNAYMTPVLMKFMVKYSPDPFTLGLKKSMSCNFPKMYEMIHSISLLNKIEAILMFELSCVYDRIWFVARDG